MPVENSLKKKEFVLNCVITTGFKTSRNNWLHMKNVLGMQTTSVSEQHQISRWELLLPIYQVFNLNGNHGIAYNGTNQQSSLEILYALLA